MRLLPDLTSFEVAEVTRVSQLLYSKSLFKLVCSRMNHTPEALEVTNSRLSMLHRLSDPCSLPPGVAEDEWVGEGDYRAQRYGRPCYSEGETLVAGKESGRGGGGAASRVL